MAQIRFYIDEDAMRSSFVNAPVQVLILLLPVDRLLTLTQNSWHGQLNKVEFCTVLTSKIFPTYTISS